MNVKYEWVELPDANIISDRAANSSERISAIVLSRSTGVLLEQVTYTSLSEEENGQYAWPKFFSDEINKKSQLIRAGEKNNAGGFDTHWSSYKNKLWKEADSDIEAFTTSHHLDNWIFTGDVSSSSGLPEGITIEIQVRNSVKNVVYETLAFLITPENSGKYSWPYHLCSLINNQSNYIKAGEKNLSSRYITPLYSGYRNCIWHPRKASLSVEMNFIASESLRKDISDSFEKILLSVVTAPPEQSLVDGWIQVLKQGRFDDIIYPPPQDSENDTAPLYEHLSRTSAIVNFARQDPVTYKSYYDLATEAIAFYTESDFQTSWWHRQIGLAKDAAECLVLLSENSPSAELITSVEYLKNTTNITMELTGANQADFAYVQLFWAAAGWKISSADLYITNVYAASEAISLLCLPVSRHGPEQGEGISVDYSFSQHNPEQGKYSQIYAGTYGFVHLENIFKFVNLLSGRLSIKTDSIRQLEQFIIEGMGWFCYAGVYDFHVCGRGISGGIQRNGRLATWSRILLSTTPSNPDALNELLIRSTGDETSNLYYQGTRAYWVNDYLCHLPQNFSFWNKTVSTRTVGSESGNGGNLKGYYMGCGSYFISKTGKEYLDIQPLWEWQRIPGTTVEQVPDFNYPLIDWGYGAWGSHDFSGVMGDGRVGVSSMILSRNNVKNAKKTAIALENSLLFMGTSIDTTSATHPVFTSVNQSFRNGEITLIFQDGHEELLVSEQCRSSEISEVIHDGSRYVFQHTDGQVVTVDARIRSGSWQEIDENESDDLVQGEVFSLWIEHQKGQSEQYCYEIRPVDSELKKTYATIINSADCQVLIGEGSEFAAGAVYASSDNYIQLRHVKFKLITPLAFIARNTNDSILELTLSDPTQKLAEAEIMVDWGHLQYSKKLPLPTRDDFKGQSVRFVLTTDDL